ncbi:hypothetical protein [Maribacter sp. 1_MG-2023]|uniref:hypothetical protein n=1 Tax=Maribacter sp. 1_MG-2023 TaxID=3062677 RepID=UPI0026E475DD|nr:hypothetical protein [Maribacter sp. 1_MG-2023]MDO6472311.1 hypothetical protein [Maribacter sp. 1_MG-2023]
MQKSFQNFIIVFLAFNMHGIAQELSQTLEIKDGFYIYNDKAHQKNSSLTLLQKNKSSKKKQIIFSNINSELEINNFNSNNKLGAGYFQKDSQFADYFYSPSGENFVFFDGKDYININGEKKISDIDLNGDIEENPKYNNIKQKWVDVISKEFLTDTHIISLGRKTGSEHRKNGDFKAIEIYIYKKELNSLQETYNKLELPEGYWFAGRNPKLFYYNSKYFMLKYTVEGNKELNSYHVLKFDYKGKLLSNIKLSSKPTNDKENFALVNYGADAFTEWNRISSGGHVESTFYRANINSFGAIKYSEIDNSFYLISGLQIENEDDGFIVTKYDNTGKLDWIRKHLITDSNLVMSNSYNRHLYLDISKDYAGVSYYTKKGKRQCKFFLLNKDDGELIVKEEFKNYDFYKLNGLNDYNYNGLYSRFILKDSFTKKIRLNRQTILGTIFSEDFRKFVTNSSENGKDQMIVSYFTSKGVALIKAEKKNPKMSVYSFQ